MSTDTFNPLAISDRQHAFAKNSDRLALTEAQVVYLQTYGLEADTHEEWTHPSGGYKCPPVDGTTRRRQVLPNGMTLMVSERLRPEVALKGQAAPIRAVPAKGERACRQCSKTYVPRQQKDAYCTPVCYTMSRSAFVGRAA